MCPNHTPQQKREERKQLLVDLGQQMESMRTSEGWIKWLQTAAKFRRYSFGNQLLIAFQCPQASYVAGYRKWPELGRHVRKGERAIKIRAGFQYERTIVKHDGSEEQGYGTGFTWVNVFDVSQTDGEPLDVIKLPIIDEPGREQLHGQLVAAIKRHGLELKYVTEAEGETHGWFDPSDVSITIVTAYPIASQCRTMLHELGHALDPGCAIGAKTPRAEKELVAESVAYLVGSSLGLSLDESSIIYTCSWGGTTKEMERLAEDILVVAGEVEQLIDSSIRHMNGGGEEWSKIAATA